MKSKENMVDITRKYEKNLADPTNRRQCCVTVKLKIVLHPKIPPWAVQKLVRFSSLNVLRHPILLFWMCQLIEQKPRRRVFCISICRPLVIREVALANEDREGRSSS